MTAIGEEITLSVALGTKYLLHHYRRRQPTSTLFCPLCDSLRYSREFEVICPQKPVGQCRQDEARIRQDEREKFRCRLSNEYLYSVLSR